MGFFDANRQPTYSTYGYASDVLSYDQHNNIMEFDYFDIDGKPAISKGGYAKSTRAYDAHGNSMSETYVAVNGRQTLNWKRGFAIRQIFNERDQRSKLNCFGADSKLSLGVDGVAGTKYS